MVALTIFGLGLKSSVSDVVFFELTAPVRNDDGGDDVP